jgi:hypothetical protein
LRLSIGKIIRAGNPASLTARDLQDAKKLFRDFRGDEPQNIRKVKIPHTRAGFVIGELDGVLYSTVRDGKPEKYIHEFRKSSRPLLVSSSDGKSIHIVGGRYRVKDSGINDR